MRDLLKKSVLYASLITIVLAFAGASYATIDTDALIGLWLFDEGSGDTVADMSSNENTGELVESPAWVNGKFGSALEFDGADSYVNCGNDASLTATDAVTVMFWFRTDKAMNVFEDRQVVVGKHYLEYEVGIYPAGAIHTYTSNGADSYDEGINVSINGVLPDADWKVGTWYHVAWTLDGTTETVYVNGVLIGTFEKPNAGTKAGDHNLEIGRRTDGGLPLTGAVDEVAIFSRALTLDEIAEAATDGLGSALAAVSSAGKLTSTWGKVKTE